VLFYQQLFEDKKKFLFLPRDFAGVAQLVEHDLAKVGVAGSSPVSRSNNKRLRMQPFII
jgi:hypothetical protein